MSCGADTSHESRRAPILHSGENDSSRLTESFLLATTTAAPTLHLSEQGTARSKLSGTFRFRILLGMGRYPGAGLPGEK